MSQILSHASVGIRYGCIYEKPPNSNPTCKGFHFNAHKPSPRQIEWLQAYERFRLLSHLTFLSMQFPFSRPPHGPIIAARTPAIMPDRENEERVRKSNRPCLLLDSVHVEEAPLEFPPKCFALRVIGHSAKEPRKDHFSFGWECCYYQGGRRNTYWGSKQPSCQTTVELAHLKQSLEVSHVVEKSQLIKQWNNLVTVSWLWGSFWLYSALMRNSLGIVGFWILN